MYSFAIELSPQKKKDNTQALLLRITRQRKHKRVATGFYIEKTQFTHTSKYGSWVENHPDSESINKELMELVKKISKVVDEKRKTLKPVTLDILALWVKGRDEESFLKYAEQEINKYNVDGQYRTYMRYSSAITKLKEYRDDEGLFFSELTPRLLKSYRIYLEGLGNSETTIYADLACIRVVLNKAIDEGLFPIQDNPFLKLNFKPPKRKPPAFLSREEIEQIELFHPEENSALIKDSFLFAIYMGGLKFSDVACLKWKNFKEGKLVIEKQKRGVSARSDLSLKLHEKAQQIMKKYQSKTWSKHDYIFPLLNPKKDVSTDEKLKKEISSKNAQMNLKLKAFMKQVGIKRPVTFLTARHTFAYQASENSDDMTALSVVLGHSHVGQTELYIKQFHTTDEDELLQKTFY